MPPYQLSSIRGFKIDASGGMFNRPGATIRIAGYGFDRTYGPAVNPYGADQMGRTTYTITSTVPTGYRVEFATCVRCTGADIAALSYTPGDTVVIDLRPGDVVNVWWRYTPQD